VYQQTVKLANLLSVDSAFVSRINAAITKIPPFFVGAGGQLQEWLTGEFRTVGMSDPQG